MTVLEEHALEAGIHDRNGFQCGTPELDDYLHRFALQHTRKGVTSVQVLVDSDQPSEILGYYSLSAAQIDVPQLSDAGRKKLPRYPVPCFRMGRLACRAKRAGQELLRTLWLDGVRRFTDGEHRSIKLGDHTQYCALDTLVSTFVVDLRAVSLPQKNHKQIQRLMKLWSG